MKFIKKNWSNILFFAVMALLIIPQTRMPIQVFVQRLISFSPSETKEDDRKIITDFNWSLTSINSEEINFSRSKNKVVLINFWATWCPPCAAEMPSLQKLYNVYGEKVDFYFITSEEPARVQKFMAKNNYNFPVFLQRNQSPKELESSALPTTFVISKSGEIVIEEEGAADWNSNSTKKIIDGLLEN